MNDLSGKSFGRYHLIEKLGEGGMAVVYKAFDTRLECEVAVKIIRLDGFPRSSEEHALLRFEREAKALAQLTHANIVKVTDFGKYEDTPYLVMEYLPGGTLKQYLGKPIPYQKAAKLLLPVARALNFAHSHNIIHRDVKPSNILITESGEPMLTDFGIAKILDLGTGQTLTGTGVGIGTPEYMAPEQWDGKITPAVDIYSLGVVFYELVTGHKPFVADTPVAVLVKSINDPLPQPVANGKYLPKQVEQVLYKALAKKPEDRYVNMQAFVEALEALTLIKEVTEIDDITPTFEREDLDEHVTSGTFATYLDHVEEGMPKSEPTSQRVTKLNSTSQLERSERKRYLLTFGIILSGLLLVLAVLLISKNGGLFLGIGSTRISKIDGMEMVYVPGGDFQMGSPDGVGDIDEHPQHSVHLDSFWIDKTEVTNEMYQKCVNAGKCSVPQASGSFLRDLYYGNSEYSNFPVINLTWNQANDYCQWAGRQLPTEAQWEKAAVGNRGTTYPWGNYNPNISFANYGNFQGDTSEVGSFPNGNSLFGASDLAGNVWEWTSTWYSSTAYDEGGDLPDNVNRVIRGGDWRSSDSLLSSNPVVIDGIEFYLPPQYSLNHVIGDLPGTNRYDYCRIDTGEVVLSQPAWFDLQINLKGVLIEVDATGHVIDNEFITQMSALGITVSGTENSPFPIKEETLRSANRFWLDPADWETNVGFRCSKSAGIFQ